MSDAIIRARRCSICSINYPTFVTKCRVVNCGEPTWPMAQGTVDEDWQNQVARHSAHQIEEGELNTSPYPHPADAVARVYKAKDLLWITHAELLHAGYRNLLEDAIVFVNETFYELQGYSEGSGAWWVNEVVTEGAADSLEPGMFSATES